MLSHKSSQRLKQIIPLSAVNATLFIWDKHRSKLIWDISLFSSFLNQGRFLLASKYSIFHSWHKISIFKLIDLHETGKLG